MPPLRLVSLLALLLLLGGGFLVWRYPDWHAPAREASPQPALLMVPAVTMQTLSGTTVTTHDFEGKVLLLHFWATWCAPCLREFPQIITLLQQEPEVAMLALSVDSDKAALQAFLDKLPQPLPPNLYIIWDSDKRLSHDVFQSYRYPETIVVTPQQRLLTKWVGAIDWLSPAILEKLASLKRTGR